MRQFDSYVIICEIYPILILQLPYIGRLYAKITLMKFGNKIKIASVI